ncbi:unnamed protein product [Closterium sp. NIES-65]|nr:unnamed protein product [Closterium sp. NIES-65]
MLWRETSSHRSLWRALPFPQSAPSTSSSSPLSHEFPPHYFTLSSTYFLSSSAAAGTSDYSTAIPPPLISPLIGSAADYSTAIPPPLLISALIGAAVDYSAAIPPLICPLIGAVADYSAAIPPLISPLNGSAADYSAIIPPPFISPLSGLATDYSALIPPPLIPLPSYALEPSPPPYGNFSRPPIRPSAGPSACTQWHRVVMAPFLPLPLHLPLLPLTHMMMAFVLLSLKCERIAATAQATAAAAPNNAAARDPACVLAESLKSTRKGLTKHLVSPSPRSASTPTAFAPSHSDLLANWHVANARACQSQTPINAISLLRGLTSLRLAVFTTMADYIARVQTLSSQLCAQKFELSDHVGGALLLTGLTTEYIVHVTLYGECPADQWSFSCVSAFLHQAKFNIRSCPPTTAALLLNPSTTAAVASSHPRNTFPPCTYRGPARVGKGNCIILQGPRKGQPCGRTNHPTSSCFQKLTNDRFLADNTGRPPNWLQLSRQCR